MKYAQLSDVKQLIEQPEDSLAVSIFIPTHRISLPHNLKADRIRMKNAIRDIDSNLASRHVPADVRKHYTKPLEALHADREFWKYRDNGVAIYVKKDHLIYYDLPIEIDPGAYVGDNFVITPLLASRDDAFNYYMLDLNLEEPRLFLGSQSSFEQILIDELPGNLENTLQIDEYQQNLQHGTERHAHHHGHGGRDDLRSNDIKKYFRIIDNALRENIYNKSSMPIIIAADRHMADTFIAVSKKRKQQQFHIMEGNHQSDQKQQLHMKSWAIMCGIIENEESIFRKIMDKARFRDGRQALVNGAHIRRAAKQGRVATLTLSVIKRTYDSVVRRMEHRFKIQLPSSERQLRNIEQTARAVIQTGGDVRALLYSPEENSSNYIRAITR